MAPGNIQQQAQGLVVALNEILGPLAEPRRVKEQEKHLYEVVLECAKFGYLLFSQPAEFRFVFESAATGGMLVVRPGLDKVSDEHGNRLGRSQVLEQPTTVPV
jgi:hypothetical protein